MRSAALRSGTGLAVIGSALLHVAVAMPVLWLVPPGVVKRTDKPIVASLAPMPVSVPAQVQEAVAAEPVPPADAAPLAQEKPADAVVVPAADQPVQETAEASTSTEVADPAAPVDPPAAAPVDPLPAEPAPEVAQVDPLPAEQAAEAAPVEIAPPDADTPVPDQASVQAAPDAAPVEATPVEPLVATTSSTPVPPTEVPTASITPQPAIKPQAAVKPKIVKETKPIKPPVKVRTADTRPPGPQKPAVEKPGKPPRLAGSAGPTDVGTSNDANRSGATAKNYAAIVRAEIGRRTGPLRSLLERRGGRGSFRLSVHFSVSSGGRVASARLARSSGDATLDQAAVSLIRSLSLPPPPGGHFSITAPMDLVQR